MAIGKQEAQRHDLNLKFMVGAKSLWFTRYKITLQSRDKKERENSEFVESPVPKNSVGPGHESLAGDLLTNSHCAQNLEAGSNTWVCRFACTGGPSAVCCE